LHHLVKYDNPLLSNENPTCPKGGNIDDPLKIRKRITSILTCGKRERIIRSNNAGKPEYFQGSFLIISSLLTSSETGTSAIFRKRWNCNKGVAITFKIKKQFDNSLVLLNTEGRGLSIVVSDMSLFENRFLEKVLSIEMVWIDLKT